MLNIPSEKILSLTSIKIPKTEKTKMEEFYLIKKTDGEFSIFIFSLNNLHFGTMFFF